MGLLHAMRRRHGPGADAWVVRLVSAGTQNDPKFGSNLDRGGPKSEQKWTSSVCWIVFFCLADPNKPKPNKYVKTEQIRRPFEYAQLPRCIYREGHAAVCNDARHRQRPGCTVVEVDKHV